MDIVTPEVENAITTIQKFLEENFNIFYDEVVINCDGLKVYENTLGHILKMDLD